jgi:hypothetical protein
MMCCEEPVLPPEVAAELATYRSINPGTEWWGEWTSARKDFFLIALPVISPINFLLFSELSAVAPEDAEEARGWLLGEEAGGILSTGSPESESAHFRRARIGVDGQFSPGPHPPVNIIAGERHALLVILTSDADEPVDVDLDGSRFTLSPGGSIARRIEIDRERESVGIIVAGVESRWQLARTASSATLSLTSDQVSRWSVSDASGASWFPDGAIEKWDDKKRPYFHARDATLTVGSGPLTVRCARGLEFTPSEREVIAAPGSTTVVELSPERWVNSRELGWHGGDLHIHMNYSGQMAIGLAEAQLMQEGEDLALANFVAANLATSVIYDGAALEEFAGRDLPDFAGHHHLSGGDADHSHDHTHSHTPDHHHPHVSRMGVEYRNDLLGHLNALGLDSRPAILATGFPQSEYPDDWPSNLDAVKDLAVDRNGVVSYCHPIRNDAHLREGDAPDRVFDPVGRMFHTIRTVEARELVADVVLAPVSGMDVLSNLDNEAAAVLLRRIVGAGSRIAATAGTDVMLSVKEHGTYSNPPGWGRMYARVPELTVPNYQDAIRAGRTFVTNGPWVEIDLAGAGIGDSVAASRGQVIHGRAVSRGGAGQTLKVWTHEGVIADVTSEARAPLSADFEVRADSSTFVVVEIMGTPDDSVYGDQPFALTSPIYVDVDGERVTHAADVNWCLRWLDLLEDLINTHGFYSTDWHRVDVVDVVHRARAVYRERLARATS